MVFLSKNFYGVARGELYSRNPAIRSDHKVARGSKTRENHRKTKKIKGKPRKT